MNDKEYMRLALELARKGNPSPNPHVGAVLVKNNRIVGTGYHKKAGGMHAEANALKKAGENARRATLYINLEPCSHYGKTPPCTDALIKAGIRKVIAAMRDPNPRVRGAETLRKAGIGIRFGVLEKEAENLNEAFSKHMRTGMPFVLLKAAMSLDGKIACRSGDSKWITGDEARKYSHELRSRYDAILVGINTVLKDDPELTCRKRKGRDPIRIVLDSALRIPFDAKVLRDENVVVATSERYGRKKKNALEKKGIRVWVLGKERVDMRALMKRLGNEGITSLLVEGGGEANASALEAGIVDKVNFFIAPKIMGGKDAVPAVGGKGAGKMSDALGLENVSVRKMGRDFLFEGYCKKGYVYRRTYLG